SSRGRHTRSYGDWSSGVCCSDLVRLDPELSGIPVGETVLRAAVDRDGREDAGRERAPGTADAVDAEDVERVVDLEALGELDRGVAEDACAEPDEDRRRDVDVTGRGRDRDETGDGAGRGAEDARRALVQPRDGHPREGRHRCR